MELGMKDEGERMKLAGLIRLRFGMVFVAAMLMNALWAPRTVAQSDFYKDKQMKIIVGATAGGF